MSRRDLVEALRAGRAAFGDPYGFRGSLDLEVDGTPMGGTRECPGDSATLRVSLRGAPRGAQARLVQGLLETGEDGGSDVADAGPAARGPAGVRYIARGERIDPSRPVRLDTRRASFVRVEIWRDTRPLAFSNPVLLVKPAAR